VRQFGIRVAVVLPGFITTPILTRSWEEYEFDETSPYADLWRRWAVLYEQAKAMASDPAEVAGWLRYGERQSDEEWFGRFTADFPMAPA